MIEFELDATAWKSSDDFYQALLAILGAPDWHGHNLDALADSIFTGGINKVDPPFRIIVREAGELPASLQATLFKMAQMFEEGPRAPGAKAHLELRPQTSASPDPPAFGEPQIMYQKRSVIHPNGGFS